MMIEKFLKEYCNEEDLLLYQRLAIRRFFAIVNELKERNIKNKSAILYIINDVYGMTETDFNELLDAMQYVSETLKEKRVMSRKRDG
jgi:Cys-tRNA synthase (O-phospho-L-seryl-tRNA:Cys-tRNA synthase)